MRPDLYEKAAQQALQSAQEAGETAPYFIAAGLVLWAFAACMFILEAKSRYQNLFYIFGSLIGFYFGVLFLGAGLDDLYDASQAKYKPNIFLMKNLYNYKR